MEIISWSYDIVSIFWCRRMCKSVSYCLRIFVTIDYAYRVGCSCDERSFKIYSDIVGIDSSYSLIVREYPWCFIESGIVHRSIICTSEIFFTQNIIVWSKVVYFGSIQCIGGVSWQKDCMVSRRILYRKSEITPEIEKIIRDQISIIILIKIEIGFCTTWVIRRAHSCYREKRCRESCSWEHSNQQEHHKLFYYLLFHLWN